MKARERIMRVPRLNDAGLKDPYVPIGGSRHRAFRVLSLASLWCLQFPIVDGEIVVEGLTYFHYLMIKEIANRLMSEYSSQQASRESLFAKRAHLTSTHKRNRFDVLQDG